MSFNGSGLFQINTSGQPVASGTTISSSVFNALTADLATGLSTCLTKDGQQTVTANIPMGGYKFTGLAIGSSSTDSARVDNCNSAMCEFRLTLTSGTPVTTTDVTAAETLYWTPYKGNRCAVYDGTNWVMRSSAEISIDVPDVTGVHDVFVYDSSGTLTLEVLVWTNSTTRATALTLQNGVLVKTGDTTRRYVGTFYSTTAGNGQIEDSVANRYLWNYYNRVLRPMRRLESTANWNYSTTSWRQANNSTSNQLNFVIGYSEDRVSAILSGAAKSTAAGDAPAVGIGLDSTAGPVSGSAWAETQIPINNYLASIGTARYCDFPGIGKHFLAWNEWNEVAAGTVTFIGNSQYGILGELYG